MKRKPSKDGIDTSENEMIYIVDRKRVLISVMTTRQCQALQSLSKNGALRLSRKSTQRII